jgi:hypothetical protein
MGIKVESFYAPVISLKPLSGNCEFAVFGQKSEGGGLQQFRIWDGELHNEFEEGVRTSDSCILYSA